MGGWLDVCEALRKGHVVVGIWIPPRFTHLPKIKMVEVFGCAHVHIARGVTITTQHGFESFQISIRLELFQPSLVVLIIEVIKLRWLLLLLRHGHRWLLLRRNVI